MTTEQVTDKRFAWITEHGGPVVGWDDARPGSRHSVMGDGLVGWFASALDSESRPLRLSKHIDETNGTRMLALGLYANAALNAGPVYWESTLKVGEGRYVRSSGSCPDFPSVLLLAETHVHESRQIGALTWWCESATRWVSWLGAFDLYATKIDAQGQDPYWHFEVKGKAPTLEEAALLATLGRGADLGGGV